MTITPPHERGRSASPRWTAAEFDQRSQRRSVFDREDFGGDFGVGVAVHDRHPVLGRQNGGPQGGDAYRPMPAGPSECALRVKRTLLLTVVRWQIRVSVTAVGPHLLVLRGPPRVAERLGIQDGTGASGNV